MARKVFISVLGTTAYSPCRYSREEEGFMSSSTKFIQVATLEYLLQKEAWTADDRVYILMTQRAHDLNWDVAKRSKSKEDSTTIDYSGLKKDLGELHIKAEVKPVIIKDGKDEKELWEIFGTVYGLIKDGENDCLYFDFTHGFRYLSMLVVVLGNYAKFLNNDEVKSITYGNFEANTTPVKPLMDLMPVSSLQDWTFAAANFIENGDVKRLLRLSQPQLSMRLSETKGKDMAAQSLNGFMKQLDAFIDEVRLCRGVCTYNGVSMRKMMGYAPNAADFIKPLSPILKNIQQTLSDFISTKSARNCFAAARWCFDKRLYQSAVTELQEGIVTYFCDLYGIPVDDHNQREIVNRAFKKKLKPQDYRRSDKTLEETKVDEIVEGGHLPMELVKRFADLTDIRNDYNHAGMRNEKSYPKRKPRKVSTLIDNIKRNIDFLVPYFLEEQGIKSPSPLPRLFLNLSNHPSGSWGGEQRKAAEAYGEIEDMAFPQVGAQADEEEIDALAGRITEEILEKAKTHDITVHVMGEMCLTFAIVSRLASHGIRCVSSTTERVCETLPDGSKRTEFHFERFREYGK